MCWGGAIPPCVRPGQCPLQAGQAFKGIHQLPLLSVMLPPHSAYPGGYSTPLVQPKGSKRSKGKCGGCGRNTSLIRRVAKRLESPGGGCQLQMLLSTSENQATGIRSGTAGECLAGAVCAIGRRGRLTSRAGLQQPMDHVPPFLWRTFLSATGWMALLVLSPAVNTQLGISVGLCGLRSPLTPTVVSQGPLP